MCVIANALLARSAVFVNAQGVVLRTIEALFGLPPLGHAATATPLAL